MTQRRRIIVGRTVVFARHASPAEAPPRVEFVSGAIDEFVIAVTPVFIGDGIPLIARRHRHVPLELQSVECFEDGFVQLCYHVQSRA